MGSKRAVREATQVSKRQTSPTQLMPDESTNTNSSTDHLIRELEKKLADAKERYKIAEEMARQRAAEEKARKEREETERKAREKLEEENRRREEMEAEKKRLAMEKTRRQEEQKQKGKATSNKVVGFKRKLENSDTEKLGPKRRKKANGVNVIEEPVHALDPFSYFLVVPAKDFASMLSLIRRHASSSFDIPTLLSSCRVLSSTDTALGSSIPASLPSVEDLLAPLDLSTDTVVRNQPPEGQEPHVTTSDPLPDDSELKGSSTNQQIPKTPVRRSPRIPKSQSSPPKSLAHITDVAMDEDSEEVLQPVDVGSVSTVEQSHPPTPVTQPVEVQTDATISQTDTEDQIDPTPRRGPRRTARGGVNPPDVQLEEPRTETTSPPQRSSRMNQKEETGTSVADADAKLTQERPGDVEYTESPRDACLPHGDIPPADVGIESPNSLDVTQPDDVEGDDRKRSVRLNGVAAVKAAERKGSNKVPPAEKRGTPQANGSIVAPPTDVVRIPPADNVTTFTNSSANGMSGAVPVEPREGQTEMSAPTGGEDAQEEGVSASEVDEVEPDSEDASSETEQRDSVDDGQQDAEIAPSATEQEMSASEAPSSETDGDQDSDSSSSSETEPGDREQSPSDVGDSGLRLAVSALIRSSQTPSPGPGAEWEKPISWSAPATDSSRKQHFSQPTPKGTSSTQLVGAAASQPVSYSRSIVMGHHMSKAKPPTKTAHGSDSSDSESEDEGDVARSLSLKRMFGVVGKK
ncbi:hypothetical protein M427DRAFT_44354 [Gonapodya prolifera JEL478]|uniref:Uncharacterized protein n=1 Tax=Gonapodya prolifera (strain JEL478) TaxID=1344416 RepID=A0A139AH56_GONPJ|nr:hypothetical protein M427DRAFT_44354 [Gonapodya prolifera JEL478]|eukprot:KXS15775.1 hypothetical protein M427DRAFT_44354 [Gonapodya prolifera JEL478]